MTTDGARSLPASPSAGAQAVPDKLAGRLAERLAAPRPILADGGVTTGLQALGLPVGERPEAWCVDRPEAVREVHRAFAAAGAEIVTTNSFGANHARYGDEAEAIATASVRLAREAAPEAIVAGSIGPVGSKFERRFLFAGHAAALAGAGVDVLWFETLADAADAEAALAAARPSGLPYALTFDPSSVAGGHDAAVRFVELVGRACRFDPAPAAVGVNCGLGPEQALKAIAAIGAIERPLVVRANAGLPALKDGTVAYPFGVEEMAGFAIAARRLGARIVGGCCGVDAAMIGAMAETL